MRCICTNSAGSETEQGHKVKLQVLTPLNFLTLPSFSVTSPSCEPGTDQGTCYAPIQSASTPLFFYWTTKLTRSAENVTQRLLFTYATTSSYTSQSHDALESVTARENPQPSDSAEPQKSRTKPPRPLHHVTNLQRWVSRGEGQPTN